METRTLLLALHIISGAAWIGADLVQFALTPFLARGHREAGIAWARAQARLHQRYYAVVVTMILITGVLLVLDGGWSWSSGFIWVGIGVVLVGSGIGGGVLGPSATKRGDALEAGDDEGAARELRRNLRIAAFAAAIPFIAVVAMVDKWQAS